MEKEIIEYLKRIEKEESVIIIYALEAGSRAWGYSSSNSDYDVRFIYLRPKNEYLKINENRDVIEYKINDKLDIIGWDLKKALKLLHSSNPTLIEWIKSPLVYITTEFFENIKSVMEKYFSEKKSLYHYLNMATTNYSRFIMNKDEVEIKKYFYIIRPILACLWILEEKVIPPFEFEMLFTKLDSSIKIVVNDLIDSKRNDNKPNYVQRVEALDLYISDLITKIKNEITLIEDKSFDYDEINNIFIEAFEHYYK